MASFFRKNLVPLLKKMVLPASVVSSPSLETSSGESSPTPPTNVSTVSIISHTFNNKFKIYGIFQYFQTFHQIEWLYTRWLYYKLWFDWKFHTVTCYLYYWNLSVYFQDDLKCSLLIDKEQFRIVSPLAQGTGYCRLSNCIPSVRGQTRVGYVIEFKNATDRWH